MDDNKINQLLGEWRIDATVPRGFNSAVWRRIEKGWPVAFAGYICDWLNELFARPAVALSYVATALVLGLAAGQVHASRDLQSAELQAKSRYIQTVDPYAKPVAP